MGVVVVVDYNLTMLSGVCIGRRCLLNSPIEQLHDGPYQDLQAARAGVLYTKDTHNERVVLCARERAPAIIIC